MWSRGRPSSARSLPPARAQRDAGGRDRGGAALDRGCRGPRRGGLPVHGGEGRRARSGRGGALGGSPLPERAPATACGGRSAAGRARGPNWSKPPRKGARGTAWHSEGVGAGRRVALDGLGSCAASSAMPCRMSRSLTVSASRPSRLRVSCDDPTGDDHRRPVRVEARHSHPYHEWHERHALHLSLDRLERQAVAVDPVAVVFLDAELDRRQAGDRPGDADRVVDDEVLGGIEAATCPAQAPSSLAEGGSPCRKRSVSRTEPMSTLCLERTPSGPADEARWSRRRCRGRASGARAAGRS